MGCQTPRSPKSAKDANDSHFLEGYMQFDPQVGRAGYYPLRFEDSRSRSGVTIESRSSAVENWLE
jgi:hypothetical protein